MKNQFSTEAALENLVNAQFSKNASARERHVYREALRGLVRLAVSEQLVEMKTAISKAAGTARLRGPAKPMASGETVQDMPVA